MKISIFKVVLIVIRLLLSQVQAFKSTHPPGWYIKVKKAEYEAKAKEEAARAKEKELSRKLLEEMEQNPVSLIIQEEEKVLEMMEDQEIPAGSGNRYCYLPARQDEGVTKTSRPKYLPINTCQYYGIGFNSKVKYLQPGRQKRCGITSGLIKAGEKLLDGSPGGFLIEMVKT